MTPSSTIRRGVVMLPSTRPVERMITFSVEIDLAPDHAADDHGARVQGALGPAVLPHEDLALGADDAGEIPVDAQQAVQVELALEPRALPDDRIDEGIVGDVRIAQSLLLRFTAMVEAFSGVMERNCMGLT